MPTFSAAALELDAELASYLVDEVVTVHVAAPASGQFSARMTTLAFPVRSDGISLSKLRAEWLRSKGLQDIFEDAQEEPA